MAKLKRAVGPAPSDIAVLLVDDEPIFLNSLAALLAPESLKILTARSGLHALEVLRSGPIALVVADYWMPGMNGIQLLDEVKRLYPNTGRVLLTGRPDADIIVQAQAREHRVLVKGMTAELMQQVISREARRHAGA